MTDRRSAFLATRQRCTICGADRVRELDEVGVARFACGLGVMLNADERGFAAIAPCKRESDRLAEHWNQQTVDKSSKRERPDDAKPEGTP